jgi:hypothetical protein
MSLTATWPLFHEAAVVSFASLVISFHSSQKIGATFGHLNCRSVFGGDSSSCLLRLHMLSMTGCDSRKQNVRAISLTVMNIRTISYSAQESVIQVLGGKASFSSKHSCFVMATLIVGSGLVSRTDDLTSAIVVIHRFKNVYLVTIYQKVIYFFAVSLTARKPVRELEMWVQWAPKSD